MIFEMRTYRLQPGSVPEVEKRFAEALTERVKVSPLGAFFHTEVGPLNHIIHIWPYDDLLGDAGLHRVGADLVEITMLPRREGRTEGGCVDDLALHLDHEFLDLGRPVRDRLRTHPGAVLEIVIRPDVDDVVERPDFGMKESAERRYLDPFGQRLAKALLDFRHRSRLQSIGSHLENHHFTPFSGLARVTLKQESRLG